MSKARGLADLGNVYSDGALSNRNMIINGGMQVDQRNGGAAVVAAATNTFAVDRLSSQNSTGTGTITCQQGALGGARSYKIIATAAVTDLSADKIVNPLVTKLEAQDVAHLNGNTVTLSFTVETNWTGTLPIAFRNSDNTRSYVTDVAVTSGMNDIAVSVPLEAATVGPNFNGVGLLVNIGVNNEGLRRTATTDAWVNGILLVSTASTQWAKTTGNFINITNLQLELGDTATPFEHRSYGDELARCQRYYQTTGYLTLMPLTRFSASTGGAFSWLTFPVEMRAAPSFTTQGTWSTGSGYSGIPTFSGTTIQGFTIASAVGVAANGTVYANDGLIKADAEL